MPPNDLPPKRAVNPQTQCGAKIRNRPGRFCRQPKGMKTPHPGSGRCWLHGGLTPIKHGLDSLIKHERLRDMIDKIKRLDRDTLDLEAEVLLLRAMAIDFVNRYDQWVDMLETWYNHLDDQRRNLGAPPMPRRIPELEDAARLVEMVSKVVERMAKIQREGSISLDQFRNLMGQMGIIVANHCKDQKQLAAIEKEWQLIMVTPHSSVKADPELDNEIEEENP